MKRALVGIVVTVALVGTTLAAQVASANTAKRSKTVHGTTMTVAQSSSGHLLGADVWWIKRKNLPPGNTEQARAAEIAKYIADRLHGNAVTINFPIYTSSVTSDRVFTTSSTPNVSDIELFITAARAYHLTTAIRPLLNIGTSTYNWRGKIRPRNLKAFFHSYFEAIRPYLQLAETMKVPTFVYASELWALSVKWQDEGDWQYLLNLMKPVYKGHLEYDSSGVPFRLDQVKVPSYGDYTDAYFQVNTNWKATEKTLYGAWWALLKPVASSVLRQTVFQEVGFAAFADGYRLPAAVMPGNAQAKYLFMQGRWFTMVCQIMHYFNVKGAFFWTIDFSSNPYSYQWNSTSSDPTQWIARSGEQAISSCFAHY